MKKLFFLLLCAAFGFACKSSLGDGGPDTVVTPSTYVATVGDGDLAVWTIADGGTVFSVDWSAVDESGNVVDGGTFVMAGTCSGKNATFDYRDCAVLSVTPARPDGGHPRAGDGFYVLELPGVAVIAHPKRTSQDDAGDSRHNLHLGLIRGACTDLSGTYNMIHTGPLGVLDEMFGQFTLTGTDAGLVSTVDHWDYGFVVQGQPSTNSNADPVRVALTTSATAEHPRTVTQSSCSNGVAAMKLSVLGLDAGISLRANVTASGALVIDLPKGKGGVIGIKAGGATMADLRGKNIVILEFEKGQPINITNLTIDQDGGLNFGSELTGDGEYDAGQRLGEIVPLSDTRLASVFGSSAVVDTETTSGFGDGGQNAGNNVVFGAPSGGKAAAPAPSSFSGFFTMIDPSGRWGFIDNEGRGVIVMVQKTDGGIFFAGAHVAVNNTQSGTTSDGGFTRCFSAGGLFKDNRQRYCIDGPFVGYSR